jgi:arylsulfatase A-like enzyme
MNNRIITAALVLSPFVTFAADVKRPNIIFILTDDHRADALGYAGNPIVKTPTLDKLAKDGVYFRNAMVTTPISAASRASILTGLYERTHGYTFQQGPLKKPYMDIAYPVVLRQNGYYTGFFGKLGVDYKNAEKLFDVADIYDRAERMKDRRGYFYKKIGNDTVHLTRFTGYEAQNFIQNVQADKPFCLSLYFSAPHAQDQAKEQFFWQPKSDALYQNVQIPDPFLKEDKYFNALPREVQAGFNRTRWYYSYDTPEKYQEHYKGYYRMITEVDDEIRDLRKLLEEKGLAENTVIIFMGDNGLFKGERQIAGKWLMYDLSIRVPMIIYDPRQPKHNDVKDMVLNIDVPKTILSLAGVEVPVIYQGENLIPYTKGQKAPKVRKSILFEHLWNFKPIPSSEAIRTKEWKYIRYRTIQAPEELYDLKADPDEKHNLANDPKYVRIVEKLRKECSTQAEKYKAAKLCSDAIDPSEVKVNF